jgi:hypothetical protein
MIQLKLPELIVIGLAAKSILSDRKLVHLGQIIFWPELTVMSPALRANMNLEDNCGKEVTTANSWPGLMADRNQELTSKFLQKK